MQAETDIPIRSRWLRSTPQVDEASALCVQKDEAIMQEMREKYDQSLPEGRHVMLSPSAINISMAGRLTVYFQHVVCIQPERDP